MARILIIVIRAYQRWISPLLAPRCRFQPSCSAYAVEAVTIHGSVRGSSLALWRICRCHPLGGHGYDPVPPAKKYRTPVDSRNNDTPIVSQHPKASV